ncbi:hypothetical protein BZA70DRAFT_298632 [Myxozyma melibiosi]|uniref:AMP-dependent synthetase/ligase domain-containing protein n=1 Tax=Myxozyma melibiosi TaxID=54550 RepID=A0ABR1FFX0_9ASCO
MSGIPPRPREPSPTDKLEAPVEGGSLEDFNKDSVTVIVSPPGQPQGVPLPDSARPGYSSVYRNAAFVDRLIQTPHPDIRTQYDAFQYSVSHFGSRNMLGHRVLVDPARDLWSPYIWQTYDTIAERRTNCGSGLCYLNEHVAKNAKDTQYALTLFSQNRPEWIITDLACHAYNLIVVPLYDNLGPDSSEFIINSVESPILVASLEHLPKILAISHKLPHLKVIISMDDLKSETDLPKQSKDDILRAWAAEKGVALYTMAEVEELGKKFPRAHSPPVPSDILTINYTSGTTSAPKGVVLTHANFVGALALGFMHLPRSGMEIIDTVLSYLPLAHIYERATLGIGMCAGGQIAFFRGNVQRILEDLREAHPTTFTSVPRMLTRFETGIKEKTVHATGWRSNIARYGLAVKLKQLEDGLGPNHALWDRLISKKVRANAGLERVGSIVSGSAPLTHDTHQFLRAAFGLTVVQGYGLSETHAACCVQQAGDYSTENCGPPAATAEVCLRDVPDLNYLSTDKPFPRGELLIRSTTLFREYYKDPERTSQAIDADGWFHTGDVAQIDDMGRIAIIDRVKNFFKLSQGEYVAPELIENRYLAGCPLVQTLFVHGDSVQPYLVAIAAIQPLSFAPFASEILGTELEKAAKEAKFQGYERVRNLRLFVDPFTIENDVLTPTLKLKRASAVTVFRSTIEEMYKQGDITRQIVA